MAIEVYCDSCFTSFRVRDEAAGKKVRCKECKEVVRVPKEQDASTEENEFSGFGDMQAGTNTLPARPKRRTKKAATEEAVVKKPKRRRRRTSTGMPMGGILKFIGGVLAIVIGLGIGGMAIYGITHGERVRSGVFVMAGVFASVGIRWVTGQSMSDD